MTKRRKTEANLICRFLSMCAWGELLRRGSGYRQKDVWERKERLIESHVR